jgi:flavorubredoxin
MWNGTRRMAEAIGDGLASEGVPHKLFHMAVSDRNDVITELFKTKAVIIGSPTLNQGVLPTLTPILEDIRGLKFQNKIGAAFGTYGWSGEGIRVIEKLQNSVAARGTRDGSQPADLAHCAARPRVAGAVKSS